MVFSAGWLPESWGTVLPRIARRWRPASPGVRRGSSGDSASARRFLLLFRDEGLIRRGVQQGREFGGIREFHFHQPARAVRVGIQRLRLVLQRCVGLRQISACRSVNLAHRLDRFHRAKDLAGLQLGSGLGKFHEDDVAQFVLRVVRDADRGDAVLHNDPFMLFRVAVLCWIRHHITPSKDFLGRTGPTPIALSWAVCKTELPPPARGISANGSPPESWFLLRTSLVAHRQAQCSCPASEKAIRSSPRRSLRRLRSGSDTRRALYLARPSPTRPACAAGPPPALFPAPPAR